METYSHSFFTWALAKHGVEAGRAVPLHPQPRLPRDGDDLRGVSCLANALSAILLLPVALLTIQRGVIEREERYLEREFGEEYLRFKAQTRRWV